MRKPLHKHIGRHAKRVGSQFTKYLYERDTIFATLWVFIFIVVLGSIPLNLGILNPIKLGLKDFDFNDMYYSKVGNQQNEPVDKHVVIVNIGHADREEISYIIEKTASYQPKVMGLDVLFDGPRDPHKDSLLTETVNRHPNLVLAARYMTDSSHKLIAGGNYFKNEKTHVGYVNFPYQDDEILTIRAYYPFKKDEKIDSLVLPSFSSRILQLYNDSAYERIKKKIDKKVIINYTRRVTDKNLQYQVVELDDLMNDNVDSAALRGKIALLAYFNPSPLDIEDKKFTPMNAKFAGKSVPDMNGIVIHANILSMVLENNFIKKVPLWLTIIIAIIVCWLHMSFFVRYYLESHIWFHLVAKIAQVASAIFFVWLGIYIYEKYHLKVDLKLSLVTIVMAVDVIYFYEAWAVWMHKKFNFQTVFKPHHH